MYALPVPSSNNLALRSTNSSPHELCDIIRFDNRLPSHDDTKPLRNGEIRNQSSTARCPHISPTSPKISTQYILTEPAVIPYFIEGRSIRTPLKNMAVTQPKMPYVSWNWRDASILYPPSDGKLRHLYRKPYGGKTHGTPARV